MLWINDKVSTRICLHRTTEADVISAAERGERAYLAYVPIREVLIWTYLVHHSSVEVVEALEPANPHPAGKAAKKPARLIWIQKRKSAFAAVDIIITNTVNEYHGARENDVAGVEREGFNHRSPPSCRKHLEIPAQTTLSTTTLFEKSRQSLP